MTDLPECTCPLIDVSRFGPRGKEVAFVLGDTRGSGCPIHETEAMRNEIKDAERKARYGERNPGGSINPGSTYWVGELGPAPLIVPRPAPVDTDWITLETFKVSGWWVAAIVLVTAAVAALITYVAITFGS